MTGFKIAATVHMGGLALALATSGVEGAGILSELGVLGSAGAAVVMAWMFIQAWREERKSSREEALLNSQNRREERAELVAVITTERERSDRQRKEFSDVLRHYREQSTQAAENGVNGLKEVIETVHELKDAVHSLKESHADFLAYVERATNKLNEQA